MSPPHTQETSSPPVSSRQRLIAQLRTGWGTPRPGSGEGEDPMMVPKCFPLSSSGAKRTSPLQSVCQVDLKRVKLVQPSRDVNCNKSSDQGNLSFYKEVGGGEGSLQSMEEMSSSRSPVVKSQVPVSNNQQSALYRLVPSKEDLTSSEGDSSVVQLLDRMAVAPLDTMQALGSSSNCAVIHKLDVEDIVNRSKGKVDRLMKKMEEKMVRISESTIHGLVHWGGEKEVEWICLGEEEQRRQEREGVGSSTSGVEERGRYSYGEKKKTGLCYAIESECGGAKEDDIYDFDNGDEALRKQTRYIQKKTNNFIDDSDDDFIDDEDGSKDDFIDDSDEEWSKNPKKKRKGQGKGKKVGRKVVKKPVVGDSHRVDEYFDKADEHTELKVPIAEDPNSKSHGVDSFYGTVGYSTRVPRDYRRAERGTCPMCSKEMGLAVLQTHASECMG